MAGAGKIEDQDTTVDERFQSMQPMDCSNLRRSSGKWYPAKPPLWGCNGGLGPSDYFGRTMVQNLPSNIKVGVVVVAVPGCDIALFNKTGFQGYDTYNQVPSKYNGSGYAWLIELAKLAQKDGVIKGFLLHQGETNNGDKEWPKKVKVVYDNLINDLNLDASNTPLLVGELLYKDQGGICWGHNSVIEKVPEVIPNSFVISAKDLPGKDEFHFSSAGNREFGIRYAEKMLTLIHTGIAPTVSITDPSDKSEFTTLDDITLRAIASDSDGNVVLVNFYDETTLIGADSTPPYSISWSGMNSGTHILTAKAIDDQGVSTTSAPITVYIKAEKSPFNKSPHQIPGRIEAEEYDRGGEGIAYHEVNSNGNEGKAALRNDQVDVEVTCDTTGLYNICYILKDEWLEYSVNVNTSCTYDIDLRVATIGDDKSLHIEIDGIDVSGKVNIPNTEDWQNWTTITVSNIDLTEGPHALRIIFDANYMNLNFMEFKTIATGVKNNFKKSKNNFYYLTNNKIKINGEFEYKITNINGSLIESGKGSDILHFGKNRTPGIYMLSVKNYNGMIIRKILKR